MMLLLTKKLNKNELHSLRFAVYRYQLFLQVKQDVLQGRLPVSFELAAELGAYIIQCEY